MQNDEIELREIHQQGYEHRVEEAERQAIYRKESTKFENRNSGNDYINTPMQFVGPGGDLLRTEEAEERLSVIEKREDGSGGGRSGKNDTPIHHEVYEIPAIDSRKETASSDACINCFPVYYGYLIAFVATLAGIVGSVGQTFGVSMFYDSYTSQLENVSRSTVSYYYSLGTLTGGLSLPFLGYALDKLGARISMTFFATMLGLTCNYMAAVVYNGFSLGIGFMGLRLFGQGGIALSYKNIIALWWVNKRGTISGIAGAVIAIFGVGGYPVLIEILLRHYTWRETYNILSLFEFIVAILSFLLIRNRPELYGLPPDGEDIQQSEVDSISKSKREEEVSWTPKEAFCHYTFWVVALSATAINLTLTALHLHMVPLFEDVIVRSFEGSASHPSVIPLAEELVAKIFAPVAFIYASFSLVGGYFLDRFPAKWLLVMSLLFMLISMIILRFVLIDGLEPTHLSWDTWIKLWSIIFGIFLGAGHGLWVILMGVMWAQYYGRDHLGTISGGAQALQILGSSIAPIPFGVIRDKTGSYNVPLVMVQVLMVVGIFSVAFFGGKPKKNDK